VAKRAAKPVAVDPQAVARTKFLEQGIDPVIAKKALEDATAVSRALWLSFLTFGTYLVITFAGVTHRDLLLETPITLPVLNAKLPLVTFFWVAPILFVIFHLYLLLSLKLLADQVHNYVGHMEEVGLDTDAQDRARLQLPNFVVVQVLGGTSSQINSWAGKLLSFTAFLTLVAGPLILLLFAQLMFLPYHGWGVTMAQRVMVTVDLVFIWYFWRAIRRPQREGFRVWRAVASAAVVLLTFFGFMYPGERFYSYIPKMVFTETGNSNKLVGLNVLYNTLVLLHESLVDDDLFQKLETRNHEKNQESWQGVRSISRVLDYRDFRFASFEGIDLRKVSVGHSSFDGADLAFALLQGSSLTDTSLRQATLAFANLDESFLARVTADGAWLGNVSLKGAHIEYSDFFGATFLGAELQGTSISNTEFSAADFEGTSLQGADLFNDSMLGADLGNADLRGATFTFVSLQAARLDYANLNGLALAQSFVWHNVGENVNLALIENLGLNIETPRADKYSYLALRAQKNLGEADIQQTNERIAILDPFGPVPKTAIDWTQIKEAKELTPESKLNIYASLGETACDEYAAPFIAKAIINARLDSVAGETSRQIAPIVKKLLAGCPGMVGMDQSTIKILKKLEAEFAIESKPAEGQ
jgi:uncharacterized protein YjbI with pentapeptide repeats